MTDFVVTLAKKWCPAPKLGFEGGHLSGCGFCENLAGAIREALERTLDEVGMEANRHAHLVNQRCSCCAKWYAAIAVLRKG